jgi:hypothetical protein
LPEPTLDRIGGGKGATEDDILRHPIDFLPAGHYLSVQLLCYTGSCICFDLKKILFLEVGVYVYALENLGGETLSCVVKLAAVTLSHRVPFIAWNGTWTFC